MQKILIKVNSLKELNYKDNKNVGYIIGMKGYSLGFDLSFSLDKIKEITNQNPDKDIFVSFNREIFNNELKNYKENLVEVSKLHIKGIIIGDVAALTYGLKANLIIDQKHLNNASLSLKHYENDGCFGAVLTNDITLNEINEIAKKTNLKLFKEVFGLCHVATSKRQFIKNYEAHFGLNNGLKKSLIKEANDNSYYHLVEGNYGSEIYSSRVLNLFNYINDLDVSYIILNSYLLDKEKSKKVFDIFINNKVHEKAKISKLFDVTDGFINKKTIYKVRSNEEQ